MFKKPYIISLLLLFSYTYLYGQGITIINSDGSALTTRYCWSDTGHALDALPSGGTFSGCGVLFENGQWYFNPVTATQGISTFPYQCTLTYTVNGNSTTANLLVWKPVVVSPALQDLSTCIDSVRLHATMLYGGAYDYEWTPAAPLTRADTSVTDAFVSGTTTFYFTATDRIGGCQGKDSITITRHPVPQLTVEPTSIEILSRRSVQLQARGADFYEWFPKRWIDDAGSPDPVVSPQEPTIYTVIGHNHFDCSDTATVTIHINEQLMLPNAFTPNGDGLNDFFSVKNMGYQGVISFRIFDRWGQLVFETQDAARGWNGNFKGLPAAQGTYFYDIQIPLRNGNVQRFKGDVSLIR